MSAAPSFAQSSELVAAYAHCRAIAKEQAKNFYYAFRVLPAHKSDAMCAVYAFMRKADDLADDESLTIEQRREAMAEWTDALHAARTEPTSDPVFLALRDTQQRFGISDALLDQLVQGTTMDLEEVVPGLGAIHETVIAPDGSVTVDREFQVYDTFDDLYRYCYLVASVVGLVCIRIFGYTDIRAELLAEHTGVAFQLTNILRDVREDFERGRIYLPRDDQQAHGIRDNLAAFEQRNPAPAMLALLRQEIDRAQAYYRAADDLIPLLETDSRPAMRVLVDIYQGLLTRIAADPSAVFRKRVSVPTATKLAILGRGLLASTFARAK